MVVVRVIPTGRMGMASPRELTPMRGFFVNGRPEGKGLYTWASGATLEGIFKDGKAHGAGIYVSAKGVRREGQYKNGKPEGWALSDCPTTPGPLAC